MTSAKQRLDQLKENWRFSMLLGISLLYFSYKGVLYFTIGSFVPLLVIGVIVLLFYYGIRKSNKAFQRVMIVWSVLLICWAFVRILLTIVNQFVKPIPEGHVYDQLGVYNLILSLMFLFVGIYSWRHRKVID